MEILICLLFSHLAELVFPLLWPAMGSLGNLCSGLSNFLLLLLVAAWILACVPAQLGAKQWHEGNFIQMWGSWMSPISF